MKTELKAKFLQHLNQSKQDQGFTLIELLVVIIIIGILSAIALPSFLNQANKAKQSEAKTIVGSMNRAQQAYLLENGEFVTQVADFGELGLGVATGTENYKYGFNSGDPEANVTNWADAEKNVLKTYHGGVVVGKIQGTGEATSLAVLCESNEAVINNGPQGSTVTVVANPPVCDATAWKDLSGG
ncbi:MAG: prepilin-type N-terminal cleavage/methylation domain-containing protein [Symploca sp. SIO1A3]|nr:prepilin-type N-terminal cleavage/methylation domain-containing protein [Symploca sp. SIO1A3]